LRRRRRRSRSRACQAPEQGLSKSQKRRAKKKAKAPAAEGGDGDADSDAAPAASAPAEAANGAAGEEEEEGGADAKKKKKKKKGLKQTEPPSVPIDRFFPTGVFPEGEWQSYKDECAAGTGALALLSRHAQSAHAHLFRSNLWRETSAEMRERARLQDDMVNEVRKCAEVHRTVRRYIRGIAKPGIKLADMCECLEDSVRHLIDARGLEAGIAFPTGCSLDYVAAHWTPNAGDNTVLTYDSVMKLGAGVRSQWWGVEGAGVGRVRNGGDGLERVGGEREDRGEGAWRQTCEARLRASRLTAALRRLRHADQRAHRGQRLHGGLQPQVRPSAGGSARGHRCRHPRCWHRRAPV